MTRIAWALAASLLLAGTASAQNTLTTLDFQDSSPFNQLTHTSTTPAVTERSNQGTCGGTNFWSFTRTAAATGNGGYNNRGFVRWVWCDYDTTTAGFGSGQSGWYSGSAEFTPTAGWQSTDTVYIRMRLYFETGLIRKAGVSQVVEGNTVTSETHHHFKWMLLQKGTGGDNRAIIFFSPGDLNTVAAGWSSGTGGNCNSNVNQYVCVSIQRNIDHGTCAAYVPVPVGQWVSMQFAFKTGATGTGFVKAWLDNNTSGSPTAQDTSCDPWTFNATDMDGGFDLGNAANNGTATDNDFAVRMMDAQIGLAFDSSWYAADGAGGGAGGGQGGNPGSTPLRGVIRVAKADLKGWMRRTE